MPDWRKQLQPASFKGVLFEVLSDSSTFGRRIQVHEFVQRDKPFCEDLGRVTRRFSVNAFFGGDDCLDKRDAFLAAIDEDATGELVLPSWGAMQATALPGSVDHSREDGGIVWIALEFVESGDKGYPVATPATDAQLSDAAGSVLDAGSNWFEEIMAHVDAVRVNIAAATAAVQAAYGMVTSTIGTITRVVASAADLVRMVLNAPGNFLQALRAAVGGVRNALKGIGTPSSGGNARNSAASVLPESVQVALGNSAQAIALGSGVQVASPQVLLETVRSTLRGSSEMNAGSIAGGADTQMLVMAVNTLVRHVRLAVALEAAAQLPPDRPVPLMPATPTVWQQASQSVVRPDVLYQPDVLAARDELEAALWQALQSGGGRPPMPVLNALQDARTKARRHMAAVASSAVPLVTVTPPTVQPALVLAYRQWGDATRAKEIVQRNRVPHPGFVAPQPLQVARK